MKVWIERNQEVDINGNEGVTEEIYFVVDDSTPPDDGTFFDIPDELAERYRKAIALLNGIEDEIKALEPNSK